MKETIDTIVDAISKVGFPIACCCFLLHRMTKQDEINRDQQEKLRKTIESNSFVIKGMKSAVDELIVKMKGE